MDWLEFGGNSHLASVVHNWGKIYEGRIRALVDNEWEPVDLWPGLKEGTSTLAGINRDVPQKVVAMVNAKRKDIISGKKTVFDGPIKNTRGRTRVKLKKTLNDDQLRRMNWYVEGVIGDLRAF